MEFFSTTRSDYRYRTKIPEVLLLPSALMEDPISISSEQGAPDTRQSSAHSLHHFRREEHGAREVFGEMRAHSQFLLILIDATAFVNRFGCQIPLCEPYWYQGGKSPYYRQSHVDLRNRIRKFVEERLKPNLEEWIECPEGYPKKLHEEAFKAGIQGVIYDRKWGGTRPDDFDAFHELIIHDEMARTGGSGGIMYASGVLGQMAINSMALPPILLAGTEEMKRGIARDVVQGRKNISLAISEPGYGSDVAGLETSAKLQGDHYIVNGSKKWAHLSSTPHTTGRCLNPQITYRPWEHQRALMADYFTVAVRTGSKADGMNGLFLLLLDKNMPGISIRKMRTQGDHSHHIAFMTFEDVRVPRKNLIGEEGKGFYYIVYNFNHERFIIAAATSRMARTCYEEAVKWAMDRKTFGKHLYKHQVFGGSSIVREGRGAVVERLSREVRSSAIPGGSEEILLDFAMRSTFAKAKKLRSKL
eukprot:jgi/Bigna1/128065/aug1.5_g2773